MEQTLVLKNKGLYTLPNEYNTQNTPDGALTIADNVVIDKDNVVECRRGYSEEFTLSDSNDRVVNIYFYQGKMLLQHDTNKLGYVNSGTLTDYTGTYVTPSSDLGRIRFVEAQSNLFFKTSAGVYKLDAYNSTPKLAGVPKALDIKISLNASVSGFLTVNNQIAYRCVWGIKDANSNLLLSAPSQRAVLINPAAGSLSNVDLVITIPRNITTDYFFQVYRSELSGSESTEPSDELYLVYEAFPSGTDITNGYVSFTDVTPTSLVGATLYTSPSQEGILQSNETPPLAKDIEQFKNHMLYANIESRHRYFLNLISVGGTGLVANDTITIAGITYTGKAVENIANKEFAIVTTGTPSTNIRDTAESLIRVVNRTITSNPINMFYLSGVDDLAGKMLIEEIGIGGNSFQVSSSRGGAFSPSISTAKTSTKDTLPNAIYISKIQQPESVPLVNQLLIGNKSDQIKRVKALRDSTFVFKDDGIFRITGDSVSNFRVDLLDSTTKLISADSVESVNNQIYALTNQGVVSVSDTGVAVVSRNIENEFFELLGKDKTGLSKYSFAIPYESDRKYILFTISDKSQTIPQQAYVFNVFTNAWTRWILTKTCGIINNSDDLLYLGSGTKAVVNKERKSFDFTDFVDEFLSKTVVSATSTTVTLSDVVDIEIGDLFKQGNYTAIITAIDTNTLTVATNIVVTAGACEIYKAISCKVEYAPNNLGNIGLLKQVREAQMYFKYALFYDLQIGFSTNLSQSSDYIDIIGESTIGWGQVQWGSSPWGGVLTPNNVRTYIPKEKQYCSYIRTQFQIRQGYGQFGINGVALIYRAISERVSR